MGGKELTVWCSKVALSPGIPRLFVTASDIKVGRVRVAFTSEAATKSLAWVGLGMRLR